jgi:hypothetical protein
MIANKQPEARIEARNEFFLIDLRRNQLPNLVI